MKTMEKKQFKNYEPKVFEQYEFYGYLITVQSYYDFDELEGFAVPTQHAHLFNDLEDAIHWDDIYDKNNIKNEFTDGESPIFYCNPIDSEILSGKKFTNSTDVLNVLTMQIMYSLDILMNFIVLKQIQKKSITPKSSKKQRGFMQVAWAAMVKERDKKCMHCGSLCDLHAHHIKSFKDNESLRYDVNNGITLCAYCHRKHHKENGK